MAHHQELTLENFTVFAKARFEFSAGINVLVGENGTGKTHLMKLLYALAFDRYRSYGINGTLQGVFQIPVSTDTLKDLGHLVRHQHSSSRINGKYANHSWEMTIDTNGANGIVHFGEDRHRPVFIPAIDMMGHTRRFLTTYDEYQIDFDQTHRDIVALLLAPEKRTPSETAPGALKTLGEILGGEVEEENERFYLKTPQGRQPMPLVADGLRKIATLHQLIKNGFLQPGTTLFWDEPELHLSPVLMDEVVAALLELARSGVQIFLATHSYVILKELDLQARTSDEVRYFGLQATPEGTKVEMTTDYAQLNPNPIAEQFDSIYDRELTRATAGFG
jgi:energy-coupling factor transporter ATP-binding protein EcfA2